MQPVFLLSGQGSQKPGMGADLMDLSEVAESFSCASDVLGFDLAKLVATADERTLNRTEYAQPALCALSIGIAHALMARGVEPSAVLGFSLGQVSALAVSGMLSEGECYRFMKVRAELMSQASQRNPGAMSAFLKADEQSVAQVVEQAAGDEVLIAANFNCPGQIVVSGSIAAVERAEGAWAALGKRSSRLATSGGFHSPLMRDAADGLGEYLAGMSFSEARIPLICNVDGKPLCAADAVDHLARHLVSPVLFQQSVEALIASGHEAFLEVGYGGVLANLVKRIDKQVERACVQDRESFDAACAAYAAA